MTPEDIRERIKEKLEELENSNKGVAATLKKKNCKGYRESTRSCPVWQFLSQSLPDDVIFDVDKRVVGIADIDALEDPLVRIPYNVREFIREFDNGYHPELEA